MIKRVNRIFCGFVGISLLFGCNKANVVSLSEFTQYANSEESILFKDKQIGGINYKLRMVVPELMALREKKYNSEADFKQGVSGYKNQINFDLIIEDSKSEDNHLVRLIIGNNEEYSKLLSYANTEMAKDFYLVNEMDTIQCGMLHMEPANSIQPCIRISLAFFGLKNSQPDYILCFNDNILNNGVMKFHYTEDQINSLPKIKF